MISSRSLRGGPQVSLGAGAVAGALLFGGAPMAQAAPAPAPTTSFASAGPHSGPGFIPDRPGARGWGGHDGRGNGNRGHGNWGHGGWARALGPPALVELVVVTTISAR